MMMLLIATAASLLVGISSNIIIYKQAQAQAQLPPQLQKPPIPPVTTGSNCPTGYHHVQGDGCAKDTPSLLLKLPRLPNANQVLKQPQQQQPPISAAQQQLQTPSQPSLSSSAATTEFNPQQKNAKDQAIAQVVADKKLLDRLFPQIIERLDGKTLAQKIDAATLVQKIDGNTLAAKVLPYLDISANVITRGGPTSIMQRTNPIIGATGWSPLFSTAKCNTGEIAVGGGFRFSSEPGDSLVSDNIPNQQNGWFSSSQMKASGKLQATVTCLTINVGLKNVPQS